MQYLCGLPVLNQTSLSVFMGCFSVRSAQCMTTQENLFPAHSSVMSFLLSWSVFISLIMLHWFSCKYLHNLQLDNSNCVSAWDIFVVYDFGSNAIIATEFIKFYSIKRGHMVMQVGLRDSFLSCKHDFWEQGWKSQVVNSCGLALALGHVAFRVNRCF